MCTYKFLSSVIVVFVALQWPERSSAQNPNCLLTTGINLWCATEQKCFDEYAVLCNGTQECSLGLDEMPMQGSIFGSQSGLNCRGSNVNDSRYTCLDSRREISLFQLCDGVLDCGIVSGDDERNFLCPDQCLRPYYGGCSTTRECVNDGIRRLCVGCVSGYYEVDETLLDCPEIPYVVSWDATAYNVSETTPYIQVCVYLTLDEAQIMANTNASVNDTLGDREVTISVSSTNGTAIEGVNYQLSVQNNITFNDSVRTSCFNISIFDQPNIVTEDLSFNITLSNPDALVSISFLDNFETAQFTIEDEDILELDPYGVGLAFNATESGGDLDLCFIALQDVNTVQPITLSLRVTPYPVWPLTFLDTVNAPFSLNISNLMAMSTVCFTVSIVDDTVVEANETYILDIISSSQFVNELQSPITLSILDDDTYNLTLGVANGTNTTVREGQNVSVELVFCGQVAEGLPVTTLLVVVPETTTGLMGDYSAPTDKKEFVFKYDPVNSVQTETFSVTILMDNLLEGYEYFTILLLEYYYQHIHFTIEDIDIGTVTLLEEVFTSSKYIFPEALMNNVSVSALLDIGTEVNLTYRYFWVDGTYYDFVFYSSPNASSVTEMISLSVDGYVDGVLNVTRPLSLLPSNITGLTVTNELMLSIVMYDPDIISISFGQTNFSFSENTTEYVQYNSSGVIGGPYQNYSTSEITSLSFTARLVTYTAEVYSDVVGADVVYSFFPGELVPSADQFLFKILADSLVEYDEVFFISVETNDSLVYLEQSQLNVTIVNDDRLYIAFQNQTTNVTEDVGVIKIFLDVDQSTTAIPIDLVIDTRPLTATADEDFKNSTSKILTVFPSANASSYFISYIIVNDNALEMDESFLVELKATPKFTDFTTPGDNHTVIIRDDLSDREVSIEVANGDGISGTYFNERSTSNTLTITLGIQNLATNLTFSVLVSDGTALQGLDYILSDFDVVFCPESLVQNVTLIVINDDITEGVESFSLYFVPTAPSVVVTNGTSSSLFITDNDVSLVSFEMNEYTVEEMSSINITVIITGRFPSVDVLQNVISIVTKPNDTIPNMDFYISELGSFSGNGFLEASFTITALKDNVLEDSERFSLYFNLSGTDFLVPDNARGNANLTIIDSTAPINATLSYNSSRNFTFLESDGAVFLTVTLEPVNAMLDTEVEFEVVLLPGKVFAGGNVSVLNNVITFTSSELTQSIYINLVEDTMLTADSALNVTLKSLDRKVTLIGTDNTQTVLIINQDDPCQFDPCDPYANCTYDTLGSNFTCTCLPGFTGDGFTCIDINECAVLTDSCSRDAECDNTDGSFVCTCDEGFRGDGVTCDEINECALNIDNCHDNATCKNINGTFQCMCVEGLVGDGVNCTDINECLVEGVCGGYAECTNTLGSFECACLPGYTSMDYASGSGSGMVSGSGSGISGSGHFRNGLICVDINECVEETDNCDDNAVCTNTAGSFDCLCLPGYMGNGRMCTGMSFGDDPHFSVVLPSNKMLCFSVMGKHHLSYNLISNEKLVMNAIFSPDSKREEVTWIGTLGIIVKNTSSNVTQTKLKLVAKPPIISINDKAVFYSKDIDKITFQNGKIVVTNSRGTNPGTEFSYPSVLVILKEAGLKFTIKFKREHLDMFWHSTAQQHRHSHGLLGQFFRDGVEIDEVRKILIMPNKEPVPVMRRPVWAFMEREEKDDQLCWTAMNPGYQGKGLIDGVHGDYIIDNVLADSFVYRGAL